MDPIQYKAIEIKKKMMVVMFSYFADLIYGATKYPSAWFKVSVFVGTFGNSKNHILQKEVYEHLLKIGFRRTFWQLVFPGQTAGLVKKISIAKGMANEYHVRFYEDGIIECELEVDRWSLGHWTGPRFSQKRGEELFLLILDQECRGLPLDIKKEAQRLVGSKDFTNRCVRY